MCRRCPPTLGSQHYTDRDLGAIHLETTWYNESRAHQEKKARRTNEESDSGNEAEDAMPALLSNPCSSEGQYQDRGWRCAVHTQSTTDSKKDQWTSLCGNWKNGPSELEGTNFTMSEVYVQNKI